MSKLKVVITVLLVIFVVASFLTPTTAQPPITEDVIVPRLQNLVTLDGVITGNEWSDAVELPLTFRFYNTTTMEYVENRTGFIYLKHDCVDLWITIQIDDPIENLTTWDTYPTGMPTVFGDCAWIFYDVIGDMATGAGDDEKGVFHPDLTYDMAIIPVDPFYDMDTNLGGTKDIDGASGWAGGWLTIEMVHPLNSGDSIGNDPSLYPGDEMIAQFMAMDPEVVNAEYGVAMTEQWAYMFNLIITPCPVGGEILPLNYLELIAPCLIVFAIAAATTVALLKRKPT